MSVVKFIFWNEHVCPKCGGKTLKRRINGEAHPEYPTQVPYWCEICGHEEYRDVSSPNN